MSAAAVVRRRRPESEWSELVERWKNSGQSQREFCREQGIQAASLQRWRQRLASRAATEDFVTVTATPAPESAPRSSSWSLELVLPDGCTLRFQG